MAQLATSLTCDFEENTWTFEMCSVFEVGAGRYVILTEPEYQELFAIAMNQKCNDVAKDS